MILVVYYSCTLTVKLRLLPTKYRRNRVNFASFVRLAMLIIKGQWCESAVINHFDIKAFCTLRNNNWIQLLFRKMVKHCALTNVNSDRGFESRPG